MRRIVSIGAVAALAVSPAGAHEALVNHAHPHGDWMLAALALLIAGIGAVALVLPSVSARKARKDKHHDPR